MGTYYRKTNTELNKEFTTKFNNNSVVIFRECAQFREQMPSVEPTDTGIIVTGSPYQIFNMKRNDTSVYWDHFYTALDIELLTEKQE